MAYYNETDFIRGEIFKLAQLDYLIIDISKQKITIGNIIQDCLGLNDNEFSYDEALDNLNNEGKDLVKIFAPDFLSKKRNNIILHLNDKKHPQKSIYIQIAKVDINTGRMLGYVHIISREIGVSIDLGHSVSSDSNTENMKSVFLADMSNELREPINTIVGFSKILANTNDICERESYLKIIEENNVMVLGLINDIIDLSKIENGTLDLSFDTFGIHAFMRDIYSNALLHCNNKSVSIKIEEPINDFLITTDNARLRQVINYLILNALRFTEQGNIVLKYSHKGDYIKINVADSGIPIGNYQQKYIFNRFVKEGESSERSNLGLCLAASIVKLLGGAIEVKSDGEKGSEFSISLPIATDETIINNKKEKTEDCSSENKNKRITILVAEDDASNYKLCEILLRKNYDILHAWNGVEAVEMYKKYSPDIILMDINMPEMDGYEATTEIRKISWSTPIVALTAYALSNDEHRVLESGFDAYLTKPIDVDKLNKTLTDQHGSRTF